MGRTLRRESVEVPEWYRKECTLFDLDFDQLPKRKHKPDHLKKKRNPGKFDYGEFIGWDGEGITTPDGHHHYILFANSRGHKVRSAIAPDGSVTTGVHTLQCLTLLYETARDNPRALNVVYYGSYDFNMLLRDVPRNALERLRRGLKAFYGDFSIEVRFGKSLWVKHRPSGISTTLWDVGSFFQQSFVKSLQTWEVPLPEGVLDNIILQKGNRSTFQASDFAEIEKYCDQELDALVLLMGQFRDALEVCNLRISRWHGPGAIAGTLYAQHSIKEHKEVCSDEVNRASQYAYGGGRIELIRQGHISGGDVLSYDVRSCYPWAISRLPSLRNASWTHFPGGEGAPIRELSLYSVRWNFRDRLPFYPLRHRHANGSVCYPQSGVQTWCWTPEFELLGRYFPGQYEVIEAYIFDLQAPARPFTWVEDMYYQRLEWKKQGYGAERILKLGLNSLYGKMIQQLGWQIDTGKLPAWHQLEWGGYVTSAARARLFDASFGNPDIVGFETDGIFSTSPLSVELSEDLGGWELSEHKSLTYVQTGFYWLDDTKIKYRGFDPGTVSREQVLEGWRNNDPSITAQLTRHIGLNYAAHNSRWHEWGDWVTSDRLLDIGSASTKRIRICGDSCRTCRKGAKSLADGLHDTVPYPELVTAPSAPYPLAWRPEGLPEWKVEVLRQSMELPDFDSLRFG